MKKTCIIIAVALTVQVASAKTYMTTATAPEIPSDVRAAILRVADRTGIPAPILAGIASRESDFRPIIGDGGWSYGICQVHRKWHPQILDGDWRDPEWALTVAAEILRDNLRYCDGHWNTAIAAYNCGPGNAKAAGDARTTGGDYSFDVLRRAAAFVPQLKKSKNIYRK